MDELQLGKVGVSVIMMGALALVYKLCTRDDGTECFSNRMKQGIAVLLGFVLAYIAMFYKGYTVNVVNVVDFGVQGLTLGLNAIGIWEVVKKDK